MNRRRTGNKVRGFAFGLLWLACGLLLFPASAFSAIGDVLSSFSSPDSPDPSPAGLAWDGTNLWNVARTAGLIQELTTTGTVISSFAVPGPNPRGLTWDGTNLWVVDRDTDRIYELTTTGTVVSSFAVPGPNPRGVTWDGTNLWVSDRDTNTVYQLTTTGTLVSSFATPSGSPWGLTWDGTSLWLADDGTDRIYELTTTGTVLSSFAAPGTIGTGLTFDGLNFWAADNGTDTIYELEGSVPTVCPGGVVTTTVDSATGGSLRACIIWANGNVGVDTLTVPAGTYTLTLAGTGENAAATGDLDITDGIIINGNAAAATIIDGNAIDRVFDILGASATFTNLTVSGGNVTSNGGGIAVDATGSLTMSNSTVSGNTTTTDGGGIATAGGAVGLENVTLSGNTANRGGGLDCAGACTLTNVTVTGNTAPTNGDGVRQRTGSGSITFLNTIVANNLSGGVTECDGNVTLLFSNGWNLSSDATCNFVAAGDQVNTDPLLGALLNNGGPTFTHALLAGSLANDGGTDTGCPATDQRATARPIGGSCDIGAYEAAAQAVCPGAVVTNTTDAATGGSLRACIIWANGNAGPDSISFSIAGGGPHTIRPTSAYPNITDPVTIDGTTEPDFVSDPIVELDGTFVASPGRGLWINGSADGSTIRGLIINSYNHRGIQVNDPNVTIVGNWIGLDADGVTAAGNNSQGIFFANGGDNATVGGTDAADRNVISGNSSQGIAVRGNDVVISGNYIGTDSTGTVLVGNGSHGVRIRNDADDNMVGGTTAAHANIIAGNSGDGIMHDSTGTANSFLRNLIYSNSGLGIDLTNDGVTENDAGDNDPIIPPASNNLLNFPVITAATETAGTLSVDFDLDVIPAGNYRIEFFTNPPGADPSGNGEGEVYQSFVTIAHGGLGVESFNHSFVGFVGDILTVTATLDLGASNYGATSEFGDAFTAVVGAPSLIAHWNFDEGTGQTVGDSSGNGNNGTRGNDSGVSTDDPTWVCVLDGNALAFDGTDDWVNAGDINAIDGAADLTVSAWVKSLDVSADKTIIRKGGSAPMWQFRQGEGPGSGLRVSMGGQTPDGVTGTGLVSNGVWSHWAMVFDGAGATNDDRLKIYFDGIDQGPLTFANGPIPATIPDAGTAVVQIGQHEFFNGVIDDMRIYDGALTPAEVSALAATPPGPCAGITKRAFETDGTVIPSGSIVPDYLEFKYLLYINNQGGARTDVTLQDVLDPAFQYQLESIQVDNSVAECFAAVCTPAEELAIFTAVNGAPVLTDAIGDDVVSYSAPNIDAGNGNVGNLQLDINANAVWAILFSVKMP